jgi:hypothetical protein
MWLKFVAIGVGLFLLAEPLSATIIGGTVTGGNAGGTFLKLPVPWGNLSTPPNQVGNNTFQTPNLYGFDEDQNIVLTDALIVDVGTNPLPSGTTVSSHYIFFDPGPQLSIIGTVDFNAVVLAILTTKANLVASDFLGNTGVIYLNPELRGLEDGDFVTISGPHQIRFNTVAGTPGDYVRVLTAVPIPSTLLLLGSGLVGVVGLRRRFKK